MPTKSKMPLPQDDTYLQIWKIEQEHSRTRWTVTTFFLSISFAVLGLSFDPNRGPVNISLFGLSMPNVQRLIGVLIYWFGLALFLQFNRYTNFLRSRLHDMEKQKLVSFTFQSDARAFMYSKTRAAFSAKWLMIYFGILYTALVILLAVYSR
jgi:hypothetical protein